METTKIICDENWDCLVASECKGAPGMILCPRWHKIGTFEESGKSYREMYEELSVEHGRLLETYDSLLVSYATLNPDEIPVKPHKRHRPRKRKVCCVKCGLPLTEDGFCTYCQGSESPAMPQSDSEGVVPAGYWMCGICNMVNPPGLGVCACHGVTTTKMLDHPDCLGETIRVAGHSDPC